MMLLALALTVVAPSFNCSKASTAVEKLICADEQLAHLDAAMALAYRNMSKKGRADHRDWLKIRNACKTRDCLLAELEDRMVMAFPDDAPNARHYRSRDNDGSLSILPLGDGWYAFHVVGLWNTGASVNTAIAGGSFRLDVKGAAGRAPIDDQDCGWRVQRLPRNRWAVSTWPGKATTTFSCGGVNAMIDGVYIRGVRPRSGSGGRGR